MLYNTELPVAIIGGGPVGLAAAAHLTLSDIPFILFEAGDSIAENVRSWDDVKMFSPWKYNIDKAPRQYNGIRAGISWMYNLNRPA